MDVPSGLPGDGLAELKGLRLTAGMIESLERRGVVRLTARAAAELGALAWDLAYERWSSPACDEEFGELARQALTEVRAAGSRC
ncbi:hypothetical protein [Nocardia wallacei]|uniref:hypothetical protein n=1 Tax=Nocardia wallacei TaxID=480035 RepID=UPI0024584756|nr:hypothetical protein [Nocardia wallacei]